MTKLIFRIAVFVISSLAQSAYAAFTYEVSAVSNPKLINTMTMQSPSCSAMAANANPMYGPYTCEGFDSAVEAATKGSATRTVGHFKFMEANAWWTPKYEEFTITAMGSCTAGKSAGEFEVVAGWGEVATAHVTQVFPDPAPFSYRGCLITIDRETSCVTRTDDAEVAPGIKKVYCTTTFKETGEVGGVEGSPDVAEQPYNGAGTGGGNTGGGNTGGGNTGGGNTGGGNTGGGNTGGGNTGGGNTGGGNTGGGNTGGGNTGGGNTGGGNTGGGTGGNGGGQNCGAPGEPACKIDESGTPDGKGLFDKLMDMVEGLGTDREKGLDDVKKDEGKDTSLPFGGIDLPAAGECTNPVITIPLTAGSWAVPICQYIDMLRPMFTAFFGVSFFFASISMVARTTTKS